MSLYTKKLLQRDARGLLDRSLGVSYADWLQQALGQPLPPTTAYPIIAPTVFPNFPLPTPTPTSNFPLSPTAFHDTIALDELLPLLKALITSWTVGDMEGVMGNLDALESVVEHIEKSRGAINRFPAVETYAATGTNDNG